MKGIEKRCILEHLRKQYQRGSKREKGKILDTVSESFGTCRRQARRLMMPMAIGRPTKPGKRGRPGRYQDMEFKAELRRVWRIMRHMCSRHLKAGIPDWLPAIEEARAIRPDIRERLLSISAPTIDRILKPYKAVKGLTSTRSGGFREEIPIQENIWDISVPGYIEADTVAHCGGSLQGEFINSFVSVDIATIWTEARAVFGKASGPIVSAIEDIEFNLPFSLLGYDSDNGTEMLNKHVLRYFTKEREERGKPMIQVTRSREYQKNDNAHVEQRNDSVARRYLGYERIDFKVLQSLIDYYYKYVVCPMINHFFPCFKLHQKVLVKSRKKRIYKDPATPYNRIMQSPHVSAREKEILSKLHQALNPVHLSNLEKKLRIQIDHALKTLRAGKDASRLIAVPAVPEAFLEYAKALQLLRAELHTPLPLRKTATK